MSLYERLSKARTGQPETVPTGDTSSPFAAETAQRIVDPLEALKRKIHQSLLQALGPKLYDLNMTSEQLEFRVRQKLQEVLEEEETPLSAADRTRLIAETTDDILGYGPIEPFLRDQTVTEVMVNRHDVVYVEREGKIYRVDARFLDDSHQRPTIDTIVGQV